MKTFYHEGFGDLPESRRQAYAFYRMVALRDGFPGRRLKDRPPPNVVPHPIYATYLIRDLLSVERRRTDGISLEDAIRVADATLARMTPVGDALIFYYQNDGLLPFDAGGIYSGLTQARYLTAFHMLATDTGVRRYADAAKAILHSLMIPVSQGGVLRPVGSGAVIEEFPHAAPNLVLNGWTTAIREVFAYAKASGNPEALDLAHANMRTLEELLPLYDCPQLANSFYGLAGPLQHRLKGSREFQILGGRVFIDEESYPFTDGRERWDNYAMRERERLWRLHTVLSIHRPGNRIEVDVETDEPIILSHSPMRLRYDPLQRLPGDGWLDARKFKVPAGRSTISLTVEPEELTLLGSPTTFAKRVPVDGGGYRQRNAYHYLHIANLDELYRVTGADFLKPWISKWLEYTRQWPAMPIYGSKLIDSRPIGTFNLKTIDV